MSRQPAKPELAKSDLVEELPAACADEAAAVEFLERKRWGDCPCCPECGSVGVYQMKDRKTGARSKRFLWRCRDCSKQFTVRTGTVYAESLIPLHKWLRALWESSSAKNGVSSLELSRRLQISYKSALFLNHRIRHAMTPSPTGPKLEGTIEADETYVGGRPRHRRKGITGPHPGKPKACVFAAVQRGGDVRVKVLPRISAENLKEALLECAERSSRLVTDDFNLYWNLGKPFAQHDKVRHSRKEYVNADDPSIHTNTIEGFFSRLKRGLNGTFHAVSREHLHRYVSEFAYRYNTRRLNDGERIENLIASTTGKRLMAREPKARKAG